jgi:hypothetical protein
LGQFTVALVMAAMSGNLDGVRLGGGWSEWQVRSAVHGAARRLADPRCAAVLDQFRDAAGRTLHSKLDALGLRPASYARQVFFYDASGAGACRPGVFAFTATGSRVVRTCRPLGWLAATEPERAEVLVIHEVLHTLGLEENPPTSEEITSAVEARCGG